MLATALLLASAPALVSAQGLAGAPMGMAGPEAQGNPMDNSMSDPGLMPIVELIPDATALELLPSPFFVIPDAEYAGTPDVKDVARFRLESATACAMACAETSECHMATWMGANPTWKPSNNCFLKSTPRLCDMPSDITNEPTVYLLVLKDWDCSEDVFAAVMGAADDPAEAPLAMVDDVARSPEPAPPINRTPIPPLDPRMINAPTNDAALSGQETNKAAAYSVAVLALAAAMVGVMVVTERP